MSERSKIIKKNFDNFSIEAFSQAKRSKGNPKEMSNEDRYLVTSHYIAVIDGATANPPITINGFTSGEYASDTIKNILQLAPPYLFGKALIDYITSEFESAKDNLPNTIKNELKDKPYAKPYASLAITTLGRSDIIITQLGDVGFRVNGERVYDNKKEIDDIHARARKEAIENARSKQPNLEMNKLLEIGKQAIFHSLRRQVQDLQNNPSHSLGYGALDGVNVDSKFIHTYTLPVSKARTLELFSDGYFKVGSKPTISSWEKAFREVEKEDPNKIGKYPSVKGSTKDIYTDDRTVVIVKFKKN